MKEKIIELLERLEKIDPDFFENFKDMLEIHTQNAEKLEMLIRTIPKMVARLTDEPEDAVIELTPDILGCNTAEEICDLITNWLKKGEF